VSETKKTRILILGGGFGGVYTTLHLEKVTGPDVQITLVSRDNYFLMTPLLFEAGSGVLEPRHAVNPIRPLITRAKFVEADVKSIDVEARSVSVKLASSSEQESLPFDHLVLALGGITNLSLVPGADTALTFKTLGDAIYLRNQVIRLFEWADVEKDPRRKQAQLTFVVVGAGLVGVELMGELNVFTRNVAKLYKNVDPNQLRFELIESGPQIAPEFDEKLAGYSARVLSKRGVHIRTNTRVSQIYPDRIDLPDGQTIEAQTIVVATGVAPSPLLRSVRLPKDHKGRVQTEATMRVQDATNIWALGDCAAIPDASGKPYPPLAQHALREARQLAENIAATIAGGQPRPFIYNNKGTLAALGHFKGAGKVYGISIYGFIAWWVWRTYYVMQMPHWSRRLRIIIDWTVALFFHNDVVQLDSLRGTQLAPTEHAPPPAGK
jgi:NADH dehydrogenase